MNFSAVEMCLIRIALTALRELWGERLPSVSQRSKEIHDRIAKFSALDDPEPIDQSLNDVYFG